MKAYSQDVRERVLRAVDHGYPRTEIVQMFGISLSTLKRYAKQQREEGHVRPKAIPGRPPKKRAQVEAGVLPQLQTHADVTLEQHCTMWEQAHGERVSRWTMSRAIKRLGWTRKKSRWERQSAMRRNEMPGERTQGSFQRTRWSLLMSAARTLR
jgi:transposase